MTNPDTVFAEFVAANPAPDVDALHETRPPAGTVVASLRKSSITTTREHRVRYPARRAITATAAAFIAVLVLGGLWLAWPGRSPEPTAPVDQIELARRDALEKAEQFLAAINGGDIDTAMALAAPDRRGIADRRIYGWQAGLAAYGITTDVAGCEVDTTAPGPITVRCRVELTDPVAVELGVSGLVAPFQYAEGLVAPLPFEGNDISAVNAAYSEYLRLFREAEYMESCLPGAYEPGSVFQDQLLALTGSCAEVAGPLADEIAQWIRDGRPGTDG